MMKAADIVSIGSNKGKPRIWLQGSRPAKAGFLPGLQYRINKDPENETLELELINDDWFLSSDDIKVVSRKIENGRELPVMDLNSDKILGIFAGYKSVRVIVMAGKILIMPVATDLQIKERLNRLRSKMENNQPLSIGSLAHGGGVSTLAIHQGLQMEGVNSNLVFANETRHDLLDQAEAHNLAWTENTIPVAMPIQELAFDSYVLPKLGTVDILEAGLSCSGASVAGRAKLGLSMPEAHPDVGHLLVGFLAIIARLQPVIIKLENVKPYASSASMAIIRNQLRDMGYEVHETTINAADWNCLEHRERMCAIAVTKGIDFDWEKINRLMPSPEPAALASVLDDIADDDPRWSQMQGLKKKQVADKLAGKGFAMQICKPSDSKVPTITKGYAKIRSTDPKLSHPSNPDLLRQFTVEEHAKIKGIPLSVITGTGLTLGHELLGQSVCFLPFVSVGRLIAKAIKAFVVAKVLCAPEAMSFRGAA